MLQHNILIILSLENKKKKHQILERKVYSVNQSIKFICCDLNYLKSGILDDYTILWPVASEYKITQTKSLINEPSGQYKEPTHTFTFCSVEWIRVFVPSCVSGALIHRGIKWSLRVFASMRALRLFFGARAVVNFLLRAAST